MKGKNKRCDTTKHSCQIMDPKNEASVVSLMHYINFLAKILCYPYIEAVDTTDESKTESKIAQQISFLLDNSGQK